jgi:hypothetical protein
MLFAVIGLVQNGKPDLYSNGADPFSYIQAAEHIGTILSGNVDIQRTPLYPLFIAVHRTFFGQQYLQYVVFSQKIIALIAVYFFYRIGEYFFKKRVFVIIASLLFISVQIFIKDFTRVIMTESLSVSAVVFFFYGILVYSQRPAYYKAVVLGLGVFLLIMLRPAFLIFLPIIFVFWCGQAVFFRGHWKKEAAGLLATVCSLLLILGYNSLIYKKCGVFHISVIAVYNQFQCVIQSQIYQNGSDKEINERIQQCLDEFKKKYPEKVKKNNWLFDREVDTTDSPLGYVRHTYPYTSLAAKMSNEELICSAEKTIPIKRMYDYSISSVKNNKATYTAYILQKLVYVPYTELRLGFVYCTLFVSALMVAIFFRHYRSEQIWLYVVMFLFTDGMIFTSFAAAFTSYGRLIFPVIPLIVLLFFTIIDIAAGRLSTWRLSGNKNSHS